MKPISLSELSHLPEELQPNTLHLTCISNYLYRITPLHYIRINDIVYRISLPESFNNTIKEIK